MSTNFLSMTDEDFLKQAAPEEAPAQDTPAQTQATETPAETTAPAVEETATQTPTETVETLASTEGDKADASGSTGSDATPTTEGAVTTDQTGTAAAQATGTKESDQAAAGEGKLDTQDKTKEATTTAADYEAFYKKIMAPFKANGKMIDLRSPEEAIQLMQMGANYTAKMQALVPHRKLLLMLENNGLLDEGKLSYLIDLDKKNPEAIKKLVKDAGVDPMEIDTSVEPAYREGNHRVTDEEATFRTTLDDMKSNPAGLATLQAINTDWDQASKELLWQKPEVLTIIHEQKESGIYDRIVTEMNRQRVLGKIAPGTPFLQSYKTVGDQLVQVNAFADLTAPKPAVPAQPVVVATTVAPTKPTVTNNDKASAASQTRTTPKPAQSVINPLSMSDDEFLKQMKNRV